MAPQPRKQKNIPEPESLEHELKRKLKHMQTDKDNLEKDLNLNITRADEAMKNLENAVTANKSLGERLQKLEADNQSLIKLVELEREGKRSILLALQVMQGQHQPLNAFVPVPNAQDQTPIA